MKRILLFVALFLTAIGSYAQNVEVTPSITPALFRYNDLITVTYDVSNTSLANLSSAYIWVWIPGKNIDAKYNVNPASSAADPAKFTKNINGSVVTFTITFRPSDFFTTDISSETQLGMLIKGTDWSNGQSKDFVTNFWDGSFQILLSSPTGRALFVQTGENVNISATTPVSANFVVYINDVIKFEQNGVTSINYVHNVTEATGGGTVRIVATAGSNSDEHVFQYIIAANSPLLQKPSGIISGINYDPSDPTKVTLCLLAPGKSSVYALGDFSDWNVSPEYLMNRDGEYFWITIQGLIAETEYGFQYLVDQEIYLADPYADKILDPDDQYIPAATYPNLKPYPEKALSEKWYFNRVSVFQTGQSAYQWNTLNFEKPAKEELVIYELLIRDFFGSSNRNFQSLIDTLGYLKKLGVNAIELMPIMEFNGNSSWGYNPTFMFAPDKYYGTKEKLKEFVDACHANGMAVILDIAMNHQDIPNPYVLLDFDFTTFSPKSTNKWFNVTATHPFSVFYDMNHESTYTKHYLDTVNYYWLNEYKVDGFRFDLSKGFTQKNNPNDVGAWSAYDETRIALLKRMADKIWQHSPNAYIILEHLSVNSEEKELAEYRKEEGKGMMLWGNLNYNYTNSTEGYSTDSDISGVYHETRGWTVPHLIGYMESHDEERLMFNNLKNGYVGEFYNVKSLPTALERMKTAFALFYTIPGPKMLWQFGELGYDFSINTCSDGVTISNDCRISEKPVKWDYLNVPERKALYDHTSELLNLRNQFDVFTTGSAQFFGGSNLYKSVLIKNNPYTETPTSTEEMNVVIAANFQPFEGSGEVTFPHTGTWYEYVDNFPVTVTSTTTSIRIAAGKFKLFTDVPVKAPVTGIHEISHEDISLYPNPSSQSIQITSAKQLQEVHFFNQARQKITVSKTDNDIWDIKPLPSGLYFVRIKTTDDLKVIKLIKK